MVLDWISPMPKLAEAAWCYVSAIWEVKEYTPELVPWFEDICRQHSSLQKLWDNTRKCALPEGEYWQRERARDELQGKIDEAAEKRRVLSRIEDIRSGQAGMLEYLLDRSRYVEFSLATHFGPDLKKAYMEGLHPYWEQTKPPSLSSYYIDGTIPSQCQLISQAVSLWVQISDHDWSRISPEMKQSALQGGLTDSDGLPDWFLEIADNDIDLFRRFACEVLALEDQNERDFVLFARKLRQKSEIPLYRQIAFEYLRNHPNAQSGVAIELMKAMNVAHPKSEELDLLWEQGKQRIQRGDVATGLRALALAWRHKPKEVFLWLNENFFGQNSNRIDDLQAWLGAIDDMHTKQGFAVWPSWVPVQTLIDLLPDICRFWPSVEDPEYRGSPTFRHTIAELRTDGFRKLAESGIPECGDFLLKMSKAPDLTQNRDEFLMYFDIWQQKYAENCWHPIAPEDLEKILVRGFRQMWTRDDFFALTMEILEGVKKEVQSGEADLKQLTWNGKPGRPGSVPENEDKLQILLFGEIRKHSLLGKIVAHREVQVSNANKPDITLQTDLPEAGRAKIYIEVKRQKHPDLLTSPKQQLMGKYLIDPESSHGVYLVGWYGQGQGYWGPSMKELKENCGSLIATPDQLEECLQKIANQITNGKTIKAIVIDLAPS